MRWIILLLIACGPHTHLAAAPHFAAARSELAVLTYDVEEADGQWTWEVAREGRLYVERRTRGDGESLVLGRTSSGDYFVQVGDDVRPAGSLLAGQVATRAALFGGDPDANRQRWFRRGSEIWFRPDEGRTIVFEHRGGQLPGAWDHSDLAGRLRICEDLRWRRAGVPESGTCSATNSRIPRSTPRTIPSRFELRELEHPHALPEWANVQREALPTPVLHEVPLLDDTRPKVGVRFGDGPPLLLIVDTGAPYTVLDRDAAIRGGVGTWGGVPLYSDPPWLPSGNRELVIADRVGLDDLQLPAMPVWVQEGLSQALDGDGLLGMDVLRQLVLDIDPAAGMLRLHPLDFDARAEQPETTLVCATTWRRVHVDGAVARVGRGLFIVDTGAAESVIISAAGLQRAYPRRQGDPVARPWTETGGTLDWRIQIEGHRLGPYFFPPTMARGRYHEREDVGDFGLVGMGTLRFFRVVFALRDHEMHFWPTDAYHVLNRFGAELRDDVDGVSIAQLVDRGAFASRQIRVDDRITHVDAVPVRDAAHATELLAAVQRPQVGLRIERHYRDGSVNAWTRVVASLPSGPNFDRP